ncbi:MAG: HEAT repeat domain-containing protein, partial [Planctomycetes bacterium]|nr:HEAT repeat domain-containing protein [Planctomycetota bacterium]
GRIQYLLDFFSTWYATPAERDEVWKNLLAQAQHGPQPGEERRVEDVSEFMDYVAAVSEGTERLQRHFDLLRQFRAGGHAGRVMSKLAALDDEFQNDGEYFVHKGQFLAEELGRHDLALDAFERAAALRYSLPVTLFNRGVALDKLGHKRKVLSAYNDAARFLVTKLGLDAPGSPTQALLTVLSQGDRGEFVRITAYLIGRTADRSVWREIVPILETADISWRRRHCATALGLLGAAEAVPLLMRCLKDRVSEVRGSAATALGRTGSEEAVPPLLECLKDEADNVRGSAATALGRIGSTEAVPALLACLKDEANNVRGSAATALGRIGSAEAAPGLLACLKDEDRIVRGSAATALARIGTPQAMSGLLDATPTLLDAWTEQGERRLAWGVNLLLRSAFSSGDLGIARALLENVCRHAPDGEALCVPHKVALDYLAGNRATTVLERQHPEVREAAELLVSLFDEAVQPRPESVRGDDDSPAHQP